MIAADRRAPGRCARERNVIGLADLATLMTRLVQMLHSDELGDMPRHLHRLQQGAESLGLATMGYVARDARRCLVQGDSTAFSAVWSRLLRLATGASLVEGTRADPPQS